ncbi:MAG: aspartate aminotransferase family protein, partial [Isosphaeraceae bacterium]
MTPEEFRVVGHRLIDWLADYRAHLHERPVMAITPPGSIRRALPASPPEEGEGFDGVFRDLDQVIVPGLTLWQHPSFFGYFPSASPLSSVLGDVLSTGLGVLGLSWQSSPALTEVEEVVNDWLRQMVGLSEDWSGVIQDTASTSTLVALICARERATGYAMAREGLQGEPRPLVVYASDQAHSSVAKAALLAGFGHQRLRLIPHDENFALDAAIRQDLDEGRLPCAVVATTGTTASTAFDPLEPIAALAR